MPSTRLARHGMHRAQSYPEAATGNGCEAKQKDEDRIEEKKAGRDKVKEVK
jgi:hypothetical protein